MLNLQLLRNLLSITPESVAKNREGGFWFPSQASTVASSVDWLYDFILWVSIISFVGIMIAMVWFVIKYHGSRAGAPKDSTDHNLLLETLWTGIPSLICVAIFYFGITGYINMRTPPPEGYEIRVTGRKWSWQFTYPNGHIDAELHVPKNKNVHLLMESEDVLHSFYIPAFRLKQDVVPGRYSDLWFNATEVGEHQVFCAEYCGTQHSSMLAKAVVHEPEEFKKWLDEASDIFKNRTPVQVGELLYNTRGCKQCHSVDGSRGIAPTFKDLYHTKAKLTDGTSVLVDENYLRDSINNPAGQVVEGFAPVMPTYQGKLKNEEIGAIIDYIKSLAGPGGSK
jgi:cytochrome c oxidase subunit II